MNEIYFQRTYKLIEMKFTKQINLKSFPTKGIDFNVVKKLVLLHQSFLSFRLKMENEINIAKQSHSPPK